MDSISGGSESSGGLGGGIATDEFLRDDPNPSEQRLAEALLRCMGRWGLAKTTIEDIAREAGVSRATAYRVVPGGKPAILDVAVRCELRRISDELAGVVAGSVTVETCLVRLVSAAAQLLEGHEALRFMRDHEPVSFEQHLALERVEAILITAGDLLGPSMERFFAPGDARDVVVWLARLVLSHFKDRSPLLDLTEPADAHRLVEAFVLPGLPTPRDPRAAVLDLS